MGQLKIRDPPPLQSGQPLPDPRELPVAKAGSPNTCCTSGQP